MTSSRTFLRDVLVEKETVSRYASTRQANGDLHMPIEKFIERVIGVDLDQDKLYALKDEARIRMSKLLVRLQGPKRI